MTVVEKFWVSVAEAQQHPELSDPWLVGSRLAWSAGQVLHGDGSGISLIARGALRVPWGASDPDSALTEQLQFTAGQGPCFDAFAGAQAVMASELVISRFWPGFAEPFLSRTRFRSVFAIPIRDIGVLDLYFTDPVGCLAVDVGAAAQVAGEIWAALAEEQTLEPEEAPGALPPLMRARSHVAVAVGILVAALEVTADDALALLRAHAFGAGRSVDETAGEIVDGTVDPHGLG